MNEANTKREKELLNILQCCFHYEEIKKKHNTSKYIKKEKYN